MKIAIICAEWPQKSQVGGVAIFNERLARSLTNTGYQISLYTTKEVKPWHGVEHVYRFPTRNSRIARFYIFPLWLSLMIFLHKKRYSKIVSSGDDWALFRSSNVIRIFHGTAKGEQIDSSWLRRVNHFVIFRLEKLSARRIQNRFAVGEDSAREFSAAFYPPIIGIIESGKTRNQNPSIIFIGGYSGRKRGYVADQIVDKLKLDIPDLTFTVITSEKDASRFRSADTIFTNISDSKKQEEIARSWILISTSSYEGFGIPVFEAMLEGTVPVCTANPGTNLQLRELPFLLSEIEDLEKKISELLTNPTYFLKTSFLCIEKANLVREKSSIEILFS